MAFDFTVNEEILSASASLRQATLAGFDRMSRAIATRFDAVDKRFAVVERRIFDVRTGVARLESPMRRRFDDVDVRCAALDLRVTRLEERIA